MRRIDLLGSGRFPSCVLLDGGRTQSSNVGLFGRTRHSGGRYIALRAVFSVTNARKALARLGACPSAALNMTEQRCTGLGTSMAAAVHHGEVSRSMFPRYPIRAITNGVHAVTWTTLPIRQFYDRHIPEWREDNRYLRYAVVIAIEQIGNAHPTRRKALFDEVQYLLSHSRTKPVLRAATLATEC